MNREAKAEVVAVEAMGEAMGEVTEEGLRAGQRQDLDPKEAVMAEE